MLEKQTSLVNGLSRMTAALGGPRCTEPRTRMQGGAYVVESTCREAGTGGTPEVVEGQRTVFSGDFKSRLTATTTVTRTPAADKPPVTMVATSEWVSACPADWAPGDASIDGGERINLMELGGLVEGLGKALGGLFGR